MWLVGSLRFLSDTGVLAIREMLLLEGETMATSETSNLVETVTGEAARLREFLSGLDAETWASDSTCEGWTIEDVVAHLARSRQIMAAPLVIGC